MDKGAWGSFSYIMEKFRHYYMSKGKSVDTPSEIKSREFAFIHFEGSGMFRHIAFDDAMQLSRYLVENTPAHVYYSSAYYESPEAEMEWKGWLGADLIFDIDADHIDSPCKKAHDRWSCKTCRLEGDGKAPRFETIKLLDILIQDFGFTNSSGELEVNFSGNRGYHVHVRSNILRELTQFARREIVDYIMGLGINLEYHGLGTGSRRFSTIAERGWRGRAARALYDYLTYASPDDIKSRKLGRTATENLVEEKEEVLRMLREGPMDGILKYIDTKSLGRLMETAVKEQASAIDTVVTTDVNRLIRLPNSLHGKTGWLAQKVSIETLEDYDPQTSAIAFKGGMETVYVRRTPRFRIGDETYGPFMEERAEVPLAVAVFLLCKKAARLAH
jgi:DNA primase small subunit